MTDEDLLTIYMWGFNDELRGQNRVIPTNLLAIRAYEIGKTDALIGDDVPSVDLQTNEEILNRIKTRNRDPEIEKQVDREADEFPVPCPSCSSTGIHVDFDRRNVSVCSLCKGEKKVKYGLAKLYYSFPKIDLKKNLEVNVYVKRD